ncbi:MAG: molybdopterin molybdotransferase MoeA [Deltaproteobacteria bacterium]|nr:molybdopterin molybdotransferase MoeA [Deltaproteobacteria bacterium]
MISLEEAKNLLIQSVSPLEAVRIPLLLSINHILNEDIKADLPIPPYDISLMDGYAVRFEDIKDATNTSKKKLSVVEIISAGSFPSKTIKKGESAKIMTGGYIPDGADTIIKKEDSDNGDKIVTIFKPSKKGEYILKMGSEIKAGDIILSKGCWLGPGEIGLAATQGRSYLEVIRKPNVVIFSTGSELREIDDIYSSLKIVNSNCYSLGAQIKLDGGNPHILGIAIDRINMIKKKIYDALWADMIISTGGTSKGDFDFILKAIKSIEGKIIFSEVAIRPGKHTIFSIINGKPFLGLSGNPSASLISYYIFGRPILMRLAGYKDCFLPVIKAKIPNPIKQKKDFIRIIRCQVIYGENEFIVTRYGKDIRFLEYVNGLLLIEKGEKILPRGSFVKLLLLPNFSQRIGLSP